jgi:uncharacterized protein (DUF1697 family)
MSPTSAGPGERLVLLLRGVNVGGHRLAMATLRSVLEAVGCTDVVTYIQSGNAVVTPPARMPRDFVGIVSAAISDAAGYDVPVVVRTAAELEGVVAANPYPGTEGKLLSIAFFATTPDRSLLDGLDLPSFLPEECTLIGRELYLHLPNGMGRAALPVALGKADRRTAAVSTVRNWNTVLKLHDLSRA